MTSVLIEDLSDDTRGALERLASDHGRSLEAEIRAILDAAVAASCPASDIGSALAALGRRFGGIDLDITRDPSLARAVDFR